MRKLNLLFSYSRNAFKNQEELDEFEHFLYSKREEYRASQIDLTITGYYNYEHQSPAKRKELFLACQFKFDIILLLIDFQLDEFIRAEILSYFSTGLSGKKYQLLVCLRPPESTYGYGDASLSFDTFEKAVHEKAYNQVSYDNIAVLRYYIDRNLDRHTNNLSFTHDTPVRAEADPESSLPHVQVFRLPVVSGELFGRSEQLAALDETWKTSSCTIVQITGFGGVGKTSLVSHWLRQITSRDYIGVHNVFVWNFYSQGAGDRRIISSDSFFESALKFFQVHNPPELLYDRISHLAEAIRNKRSILILDGLESLQVATGEDRGKIKDYAIASFLREIAAFNVGLCVITSRIEIKGLGLENNRNTPAIKLERLATEDGVDFLRYLGVHGIEREIGASVREYDGHPLSLQLLGNYLVRCKNGDIRKRKEIPSGVYKESKRVMNAYVQWLSGMQDELRKGSGDGVAAQKLPPELALLYIVGLFDRPTPMAVLNKLLKESLLQTKKDKLQLLVSSLKAISGDEQNALLNDLVQLGLLYKNTSPDDNGKSAVYENLPGFSGIESIDAHPLVREYFSELFEKEYPEEWCYAHASLFNYYRSVPKKHYPEHIFDLEILFHAVVHGCKAKEYQRAFANVYWERINRKQALYCINTFGAYDLNLAALHWFFEDLWTKPVNKIQQNDGAVLLCNAGMTLLYSGRLDDSLLPLQLAYDAFAHHRDWTNRARIALALSDYFLLKGALDKALEYAEKSIVDADNAPNPAIQVSCYSNRANIYHLQFEKSKAKSSFGKALEKIGKNTHLETGLFVYQYADFHLEINPLPALINLGHWLIEKEKSSAAPIDKALVRLMIGKVFLHISGTLLDNHENDEYQKTLIYETKAGKYLESATKELYLFGNQHYIILALLACVKWLLLRIQGGFSASKSEDVDKALRLLHEISETLETHKIVLYTADYHILHAYICLYNNDPDEARIHACRAMYEVEKSGYNRKRSTLEHHLFKALNLESTCADHLTG